MKRNQVLRQKMAELEGVIAGIQWVAYGYDDLHEKMIYYECTRIANLIIRRGLVSDMTFFEFSSLVDWIGLLNYYVERSTEEPGDE